MPTIALSPRHAALVERARKLDAPPSKLAYQIVAAQMRVWTSDQSGVVCRPWYILCVELYPRGSVVNQKLMQPPSSAPSANHMLSFLLEHIVNPPQPQPPACPTQVSFVDDAVTVALAPHLRRLNIQVQTLSLADGLSDYVKRFSDRMIADDRAMRSESAERPGLLSVPHVTPELLRQLMSCAASMYKAQPWQNIPEHVALRVLLPADDATKPRERFFLTVLGSDEKVMGFALMPSLHDLRRKYRRTVLHRTAQIEAEPDLRIAPDVLVCANCGRRVVEHSDHDGHRYIYRCARCKRLLYCDETCQRRDWSRNHRLECEHAANDAEYVFRRDEWAWLKRELACLFVDPTAVPFDDLDGFEKFKWPFVQQHSPPLYPVAFASVQGAAARVTLPTQHEIEIMVDVARTLTECVTTPPKDGVIHFSSGVSLSVAENLADSLP